MRLAATDVKQGLLLNAWRLDQSEADFEESSGARELLASAAIPFAISIAPACAADADVTPMS